ncbi:unnamed protein product [Caenorhabditis brenneri]
MTSLSKQFMLTQAVYDFPKVSANYRGGSEMQYANVSCGSSTNPLPFCSHSERIKKVAAREPGLSERIEFRRDLPYEEMKTVITKLFGLKVGMLEQETDIPVNTQLTQKRENRKIRLQRSHIFFSHVDSKKVFLD